MTPQLEIRHILAEIKKVATGGFAIALHIRYTTPTFLFQTYSKEWLDYYSQNGLVMSDPTVAWGFENTGAVRWSVLSAADTAGVMAKAAEFGLKFGTTCAIEEDADRSIGSFARADRELSAEETTLLTDRMKSLHMVTANLKTLSPETASELRMMSVQFTHT